MEILATIKLDPVMKKKKKKILLRSYETNPSFLKSPTFKKILGWQGSFVFL